MQIEIVAIGNEVLSGFTVNSNAATLGQGLFQAGFTVARQSVLPDAPDVLRQGLGEALARSDVVIATGGLGPTVDDVTRPIAAALFDSPFHYDQKLAAELTRHFGKDLSTLKDQATVPTKATLIPNQAGTAPGFIFREKSKTLILLPGVPAELKPMLVDTVIPYLQQHFSHVSKIYSQSAAFFNLCEAEVDPALRQLKERYPKIEFGIYPAQRLLHIRLSLFADNAANAETQLTPALNAIKQQFATQVFEAPSGKLEEAVLQRFVKKGLTLAAAESCTGGSFAARLTQIPGASQVFLGSIVAYSNVLKTSFLGVSEPLLNTHGAVSAEVVEEMLKGLFSRISCDYGIAITGIAGPTGGSSKKPIGTVWCAVGHRNTSPHIWKMQGHGTREMIIDQSVTTLLAELLIQTQPYG